MVRSLRAFVLVLVACLLAGGCQILSWTFEVPSQVAAGSVFVVEVTGTTDGGFGATGAVLQLPNGFEVVGATAWSYGTSPQYGTDLRIHAGGGVRDDPSVLVNYLAEANHYLVSFHGSGAIPTTSGFEAVLKVFVRAPTTSGSAQVKLALGDFLDHPVVWRPQFPNTLDFGAISGTAHARTVQVVATAPPPPFTPVATELWDTPTPAATFAFGDLDGDGRDDFVECEASGTRAYSSRASAWLEITGNLPTGPTLAVRLADFDGDGHGDLLLDGAVWFGSGGPQWTPGPVLPLADAFPCDFDGDGRPDLVGRAGTGLVAFRAMADRTFAPASAGLPVTGSPRVLAVGDLDADGDAEVVELTVPSQVRVWRWSAVGWAPAGTVPFTAFPPPWSDPVVVLDVDGDGRTELVGSGNSQAYRWNGPVLVTVAMQPIEFGAAVALDHDRDGRVDLFVTRPFQIPGQAPTGSMQLWRNAGAGAFQSVALSKAAGFGNRLEASRLQVGDLDGDSFPDVAARLPEGPVVWRNTLTGAASYGEGCGGAGFAAPQISVTGSVAPGQSVPVQISGALPSAPGFLWAGLSRRTWHGLPLLPLDLDFVGAPDCELLAEPLVIVSLTADAGGVMSKLVPLPALLPTDALTFFLQGAAFAPGANPMQFVFSDGLALKMQ